VQVEFKDGKLSEVPGTEKVWPADLVLLAMGFVNPVATVLEAFGVDKDARGNAKASTDFIGGYATSVPKVFAAGDIRRGQSLVVGHPRRPPGRACRGRVPDGRQRTASLIIHSGSSHKILPNAFVFDSCASLNGIQIDFNRF
jgi:NADPH-dependent glutamate synthase beta subunit-like oxidoreductase